MVENENSQTGPAAPDVIAVDGRGRVSLRPYLDRNVTHLIVQVNTDGSVVLTPAQVVPATRSKEN